MREVNVWVCAVFSLLTVLFGCASKSFTVICTKTIFYKISGHWFATDLMAKKKLKYNSLVLTYKCL